MQSKVCYTLLVFMLLVALGLTVATFLLPPPSVAAAPDTPNVECEQCTYIGFQVNCYDGHCSQNLANPYKHGVYFRYRCVNTCTGQVGYPVIFQYCHPIC